MILLIIILLLLFIPIYICDFLLKNTKSGKLLNKIPSPPRLPVVGHGLNFNNDRTQLFYLARSLANKFKHGYVIGIANLQVVNLLEPEDAEILLSNSKNNTKSFTYDFLRPWINDGLLVSNGEKWRNRRKILGSTFHYSSLQHFVTLFKQHSNHLIKTLETEIGKDETEILPFVVECALNDICETSMGINLNDINTNRKNSYVLAIQNLSKELIYRIMRFWLHFDMFFKLSAVGRQHEKTLSDLHSFRDEIVCKRREELKNCMSENDREKSNKPALLDTLLIAENRGKIDEEGVKEEVDTFIFGGHDTTTTSMAFCLMQLANNQYHQDMVVAEIEQIFGDKFEDVTISKLNDLTYLERCIKETLRLYPSVPLIGRVISEDTQFKNFLLPAGTTVQFHIFDMHRKANIYPAPDKFDPDRFLAENCEKRHPYAYIPFSAGPRNCLGQKYTLLEQKIIIGSIVKNFKLEPITKPEDIIFTANLALKPNKPIKIKLLRR